MRDNKEFESIEQSFIEGSWSSLKSRLDAEMPVHNANHTYSINRWLSIALLLCLSALVYISYLYFSSIHYASASKHTIEYRTKYLYNSSNKAEKSPSTLAASPNLYFASSKTSGAQYESTSIEISNSNSPRSEIDGTTYNTSIDNNRILPNPGYVSMLSNDGLYFERNLNKNTITSLQENKRHKKHATALYFSVGSFISNLDYSGYGFGFGISLPLKGALQLQTGIHLNYISRAYYFLPFFERAQSNGLKASENINLQDADTYHAGLRGFNQIVLPIGLSYKLNNRLSMNTGVRYRYTYDKNIDQTLALKAQNKISKTQSVEKTFFNHSNLGIYTGVSYSVSNHISLQLDAEWGLSSLIRNNAISDPYFRPYDLNLVNLSAQFKF